MTEIELIVAGGAIVAAIFGACVAWVATANRTARWRQHRRLSREWRQALRQLHSGHIDALPRTGAPPNAADPNP